MEINDVEDERYYVGFKMKKKKKKFHNETISCSVDEKAISNCIGDVCSEKRDI